MWYNVADLLQAMEQEMWHLHIMEEQLYLTTQIMNNANWYCYFCSTYTAASHYIFLNNKRYSWDTKYIQTYKWWAEFLITFWMRFSSQWLIYSPVPIFQISNAVLTSISSVLNFFICDVYGYNKLSPQRIFLAARWMHGH